MTTPNCTHCNDTGKMPGSEFLDCGHCVAAQERVALADAIKAHANDYGGHDGDYGEDRSWFIHQRAKAMGRASALAELHPNWLAEKERADRAEARIAELEAQIAAKPAVEQQPVAYLRFRAAQQWSGVGGHDIEHNEWYEICHAHEIGDDKQPAFPVYAASTALQAPVREVPEGWQLVPKESTGVMKDAGAYALPVDYSSTSAAANAYRAMLAAAPVQQEGV